MTTKIFLDALKSQPMIQLMEGVHDEFISELARDPDVREIPTIGYLRTFQLNKSNKGKTNGNSRKGRLPS